VQAHILPSNCYFGEIADPRTYQVITQDIIARKCYPFVVDFPVFHAKSEQSRLVYTEKPFYKYVASNVRRHLTSAISDNTVIGQNSEIGQNTIIDQSVIGANCKIGQNVTIKRCIIWDDTEIHDNTTIEDSLICDHVVVNTGCIIEPGSRIDSFVEIKANVVLPRQTLASTREIVHASGLCVDFPVAVTDESCFVKGAIIHSVPAEMFLDAHRYMGAPGPYLQDSDSSLGESDDEQIMQVMDDDKFKQQVVDLIRLIISGEYTMDAALFNV